MTTELSDKEIDALLHCLQELLSQKAENVQLSSRQLAEIPRLLDIARNSLRTVTTYRDKMETLRRSQAEKKDAEEQQALDEKRRKKKEEEDELARPLESLPTSNMPHVDFLNFGESGYLKLLKQPWGESLSRDLTAENLKYPLGVTFDEKAKIWFISDQNDNKIVMLDINQGTTRVAVEMTSVTALMIYEEGESVAVLCQLNKKPVIYKYVYRGEDPYMVALASHEDDIYKMMAPLRGLSKSFGGNIISLEKDRLRVFKSKVGAKSFCMKNAKNPCFVASYKTLVAVSDLGVNKVFIYNMDDTNWDRVIFNGIKVIESNTTLQIRALADVSGFKFVAGLQFDCDGKLIIADAKGHTMKLYDSDFTFLHRISTDFPLPFMSSFHINKNGECVILDIKNPDGKVHLAHLTATSQVNRWLEPEYFKGEGFIYKSRRGGFNNTRRFKK